MLAAGAAGHLRDRVMTAAAMLQEERLVAGAEDPLVAPLSKGGQDWPEGSALVGERVLVATAGLVVGAPLEDACVDQGLESVGEDVAGDAETLDEVIEAPNAEEAVAQDQQRPPFADDFERLGDGAVHAGEGGPAHDPNRRSVA